MQSWHYLTSPLPRQILQLQRSRSDGHTLLLTECLGGRLFERKANPSRGPAASHRPGSQHTEGLLVFALLGDTHPLAEK